MKLKHYDSRYGVSSVQPKGVRPDFTRCAQSVTPRGGWAMSDHQCTRKNGHGPDGAFCKVHAKQFSTA